MYFRNGGVKLAGRVTRQAEIPVATLPAFLCPGIPKIGPAPQLPRCSKSRRHLHNSGSSRERLFTISRPLHSILEPNLTSKLPIQCPGCGALSQVVEQDDPGFYSLTRGTVKAYFQGQAGSKKARQRENLKKIRSLEFAETASEENNGIIRVSSPASAEANGMSILAGPSTLLTRP